MSGQFGITLMKILIFFPMVIGLIVWLGKVSEKFSKNGRTSTMRVVERLQVSKDNSLLIIRIGDKFYLVTSTQGKVEFIREIEDDNLDNYPNIPLDKTEHLREIGIFLKNKYLQGRK
ncbi:flagellar biosynthetic protein FliO [Clostridium sp.]|uniref:flagellar biosynthetic protein FliO n=1 Tax=Clostridium sp. TaxID=1506 RepID=UPI0032174999